MAKTIKSTLFHSEHPLTRYHYGEGVNFSCAACEYRVAGIGYSCDECNFNIHEACLSLPGSISLDKHSRHDLALRALGAGASRRCNCCGEKSHTGVYIYHCETCDYNVHPRCTALVARPPQALQVVQGAAGGSEGGSTLQAVKISLKIGVYCFKAVDFVTGGLMSPVLDVIEDAIDGM